MREVGHHGRNGDDEQADARQGNSTCHGFEAQRTGFPRALQPTHALADQRSAFVEGVEQLAGFFSLLAQQPQAFVSRVAQSFGGSLGGGIDFRDFRRHSRYLLAGRANLKADFGKLFRLLPRAAGHLVLGYGELGQLGGGGAQALAVVLQLVVEGRLGQAGAGRRLVELAELKADLLLGFGGGLAAGGQLLLDFLQVHELLNERL